MNLEQRVREALARGDTAAAATEIIRERGPAILGYLGRVLGSRDDAADAFSLFCEQLWRGVARLEGEGALRVWTYRVAWSAAMRVLEDGHRRRRVRLGTSMASRLAEEVLTQAERRAEDQAMDALRAALEPEERALLVLRLDQRLSWAEVAEALRAEGTPAEEPALRKRFERLREKLAALARERGLVP